MSTLKKGLSNTFILSGGVVISQAISLAGFPIIARILGPAQMGNYQTIMAFIGMFTLLTFAGIERPTIREFAKDINNMKNIFESVIRVRIYFSISSGIICGFSVLFFDYSEVIKLGILFYSTELIFLGIRSSINSIYQATQNMWIISILEISRTLASTSIMLTLVLMGHGVLPLIIAKVFINAMILLINIWWSKKYCHYNLLAKFQWNRDIIKSGAIFSLIQFLNTFAKKSDIFMLSLLGTPAEVGIFAVAYQVVTKIELVRGSFVQSFFPIFSKKLHEKSLDLKLLQKSTLIIFAVIFSGATIGYFLSPIAIKLIFGPEYEESSKILSVLLFYLVARFTRLPWDLCINTSHNEDLQIKISLISGFFNITLNFLFFKYFGPIGIAYSSVLTYSIACVLIILLGYKRLKSQNFF